MNCVDAKEKLHEFADGELPPAEAREWESHVAGCPACRTELAALRGLLARAKNLPPETAPSRDLWAGIEAAHRAPRPALKAAKIQRRWIPFFAMAAAAVIVVGVATKWSFRPPSGDNTWSVASVAGTPRVGEKNFQGEARLRVGQWLETDQASSAKLAVGSIGEVNLEPNSRLRLLGTSSTDHRVELARGTLRALIWAPPRLFFVNTPSATAVDLGCAYTLNVDDAGNGLLQVTSGYVALEHEGRESIVPAGLQCLTRQRIGPGTPFAADAPEQLRAALDRFDFQKDGTAALIRVLAHARAGDAITLWHLLARVEAGRRGEIFDALARHHAPPAGVTRAGIIAGDSAMRQRWGLDLGLASFARR